MSEQSQSFYQEYIERNIDEDTTDEDLTELRADYIRDTAGYIVVQALTNLDHGGNLLLERVMNRLKDHHGCPDLTYEELREQFRQLAFRIEWAIEEVEGF